MKSVTLFTLSVFGYLVFSAAARAQSPDQTAPPRIQASPYQPPATEEVVVGPLKAVPYEPQAANEVTVGPLKAVPYEPQATEILSLGPPKQIAPDQPQTTEEATLQELKKELKDLRRLLRQIEKRLSEIERSRQP